MALKVCAFACQGTSLSCQNGHSNKQTQSNPNKTSLFQSSITTKCTLNFKPYGLLLQLSLKEMKYWSWQSCGASRHSGTEN